MALGGALGPGLGAPWSRVTPRHCAWQAWHNRTSMVVLRGRRLTHATGCVAGVALGDIRFRFATSAWQAWHLVTSTLISRGRRGRIAHPWSFCVAGASLMALGGALGPGLGAPWSRVTPRHCAWQAWHNRTSMVVLRGRRLTHGTGWRPWAWFRRALVGFVAVGKAWLSRSTSRCTAWSAEDHGTPHPADSRSAVLPHAEQLTLQRWRKKWSALSRTHIIFHTQHLSHATLSHTCNYIHTYVRTYVHTYIHTYLPFYLLDLSPPPLSFLPSLSPLNN